MGGRTAPGESPCTLCGFVRKNLPDKKPYASGSREKNELEGKGHVTEKLHVPFFQAIVSEVIPKRGLKI